MSPLTQSPEFMSSSLHDVFESAPIGFVDIGARGGVHEIVEPFAAFTSVVGFEPDPEECQKMMETVDRDGSPFAAFNLQAIGLAGFKGEAQLHRISAPTNDSLREPNARFVERYDMVKWHKVGELTVPVTTLDEVVFERLSDDPNVGEFIKIDTQGTELEILKGGTRTLSERTVAVIAEVSFCELYDGQGLFTELEGFLRNQGFAFYGFDLFRLRSCNRLDKRTHWSRERAIQADAVFFKDPLPGDRLMGQSLSARATGCLLVAAVLTEYFEFSLELAAAFYSGDDRTKIETWIADAAALNLAREAEELAELAEKVRRRPGEAAILAGGFVDARRRRNDVAYWTSRPASRPEG
jgi:FkbM family methyltransferase